MYYPQGRTGLSGNKEIPDGLLRKMLINIYRLKGIKIYHPLQYILPLPPEDAPGSTRY